MCVYKNLVIPKWIPLLGSVIRGAKIIVRISKNFLWNGKSSPVNDCFNLKNNQPRKHALKQPRSFNVVVLVFQPVSKAAGNSSHVFPHPVSILKECAKPTCTPHRVFFLAHGSNKTASKNHFVTGSKKLLFLADKFTCIMTLTNKLFNCQADCI